jgi:hypothetical protein
MDTHPYKSFQEYADHLYDVTYIKGIYSYKLMHWQVTGNDRVDAITNARKELGPDVYLVSCTKHAQDLNPIEMEML